MLEVSFIRDNTDLVLAGLRKRNFSDDALDIINQVLSMDDSRKETQGRLDQLLNESNSISKRIGDLYKSGQHGEADQLKEQVAAGKDKIKELEETMRSIKDNLEQALLTIPNIPHTSVPAGVSSDDNELYKAGPDQLPQLEADALPHWELAERYKLFDLALGVRLTGSGFPVYRGKGARLQRALIAFFLDEATKRGYEEIIPPLLVNEDSARGTGQLPDKESQMYYVEKDDLYLIPTAEVPVTNLYRGELVPGQDLPIRMTGYTPCFRREAGSYGAHVKGLNRVHQFDKVEIVRIEHPDRSYDALMEMLTHVEGLLQALELPYRILRLCGGDMGFASALTFDFEVYSAAQKRWLEVSSVSNFETFQTNRMKLRFKDADGKNKLAHTLNGSALALARIVAALLENHQTSEGIRIPARLIPYTGFEWIN